MLSEQLVPPTMARLQQAGFARVRAAGSIPALKRSGEAAQPVQQVFVVPSALVGRPPQSAAGAFIQAVERGLTVVLTLPAYSDTGTGQLDPLEAMVLQALAALAGWAPGDTVGVYALSRGALLSVEGGALIYGLDFTITDHLRIAT